MLGKQSLRDSIPAWQRAFPNRSPQSDAPAARHVGGATLLGGAERAKAFAQIFPAAQFRTALPEVGAAAASREDALLRMVTGWMAHSGPVTASELGQLAAAFRVAESKERLLRLEASGSVLRGKFTDASPDETEWCDRRLLARIHRLTSAACASRSSR